MAPDGNIYAPTEIYSSDYSATNLKGTFIHEMGHVFDTQHGRNLIFEGLKEFITGGYSARNIDSTYSVPKGATNYWELNLEQRANVWQARYYELRASGEAP